MYTIRGMKAYLGYTTQYSCLGNRRIVRTRTKCQVFVQNCKRMIVPFLMWQRLWGKDKLPETELKHSLKIAKFDEWIIKLKFKNK